MKHLALAPSRRSVASFVLASLVAAAATLGAADLGRAQGLLLPSYQANGMVRAVAVSGNTIYLGGSFSALEIPTGGAVAVDGTTAAPVVLPKVLGTVNTIVPDGAGG